MRQNGLTIVLVEHRFSEALRTAIRVVGMEKGQTSLPTGFYPGCNTGINPTLLSGLRKTADVRSKCAFHMPWRCCAEKGFDRLQHHRSEKRGSIV
jgi:energy-coupling factor transporter ATP-binding protein EcfA2